MSISDIQRKIVEEEILKYYLELGIRPRDVDVSRDLSLFFSSHKIGMPFGISDDLSSNGSVTDVDVINDNILKSSINIATIMESIRADVIRSMNLNTAVRDKLKRLKARQLRASSEIDDYLLASNNTSGYFYSYTEKFPDNSNIDLGYTNAYIDNDTGNVSIPHIQSGLGLVPHGDISLLSEQVYVDGIKKSHDTLSAFPNAVDGLSNTDWKINVSTTSRATVSMQVRLSIPNPLSSNTISQIDILPVSSSPLSIFADVSSNDSTSRFGLTHDATSGKVSFIDSVDNVDSITITMSKSTPDRVVNINSSSRYVYIFGATEISIAKKLYDNSATLVSAPIYLPPELSDSHTIDKVRLDVKDNVPNGADVKYYIARDNTSATSVSDFSWNYLDPRSENEDMKTFSFSGSENIVKNIVTYPKSNELLLIEANSTSADLGLRNPSTEVISGSSMYRIAEFKDSFIQNTMFLEEGINTTRILSIPLDTGALDSLSFWKSYVDKTAQAEESYGSTINGNSFFYGGDIGANGKSVYVETYLIANNEMPVLSKELRKLDTNAKLWDIKVYLNGAEVGYLPVGTNSFMIPWKFRAGENHIAMVINIPEATVTNTNPYLGSVNLMNDVDLLSIGSVRLAEWKYIDEFHMRHNDIGLDDMFTIIGDEIVSRKKPTTNMRIRYSKATESGPSSIRVKADMSRNLESDSLTPVINQYSVKFSYGGKK